MHHGAVGGAVSGAVPEWIMLKEATDRSSQQKEGGGDTFGVPRASASHTG